MFSDLIQRCLDAEFDETFPENGSFAKVKGGNGQQFWYYKGYNRGEANADSKRFSKYVGPVADLDVTARVERFQRVKANYRERRSLVTSLTAAGLPSPPAPYSRTAPPCNTGRSCAPAPNSAPAS